MKKFFPAAALLITIILTGILYKDSFRGYFFQDDWFSFKISQVNSITDFIQFFIPRTDVIYYRPLGMQIPFFIMRAIFGLNAVFYHVIIFITHIFNVILVYLIVKEIARKKLVAILVSFLYSTSPIHFILFYWFATFAFILGPMFFFSSFLLYLYWEEHRKNNYLYFSLILFIFGLLTNELVVTLPFILAGNSLFHKRKNSKQLAYYFIPAVVLILVRFIFFKPPSEGVYQIGIGTGLIQILKMYILWSFNWSESITEQLQHLFVFQMDFMKEFSIFASVTLYTFFISGGFIILSTLYTFIKNRSYIKRFIFNVLWYIIALLPVLIFPQHKYSYYLPIAFVGLFMGLSLNLIYSVKRLYQWNRYIALLIIFIFLTSWTIASYNSIQFNKIAHWAPRRSEIAKKYEQTTYSMYPAGFKGEYTFYITPSSENKLALNDQDGLRILFNNPLIQTVYGYQEGKESL